MKKLLVPTDFSPCAENAGEVALEIAKRANAQIVFLHLLTDTTDSRHTLPREGKEMHNPTEGQARAKLEELVNHAERLGMNAVQQLVINKGVDKIENYIEPLKIDLVVMGSHGVTGIRELIIGSQTQRVVRHSAAPVLVIKNKPEIIAFQNILFASTFQEDPGMVIGKLVNFAKLWNGTIHLLYVGLEKDKQSQAEVIEKMNLLAKEFPQAKLTQNFITTNDPEWGINHASKDINPDALAITTQLKTGALIFSHSLAESLVNHESIPVFVINTK